MGVGKVAYPLQWASRSTGASHLQHFFARALLTLENFSLLLRFFLSIMGCFANIFQLVSIFFIHKESFKVASKFGVKIEHVQILGVCDIFFQQILMGPCKETRSETISPNVEFAKRSNPSILGAAFMGH